MRSTNGASFMGRPNCVINIKRLKKVPKEFFVPQLRETDECGGLGPGGVFPRSIRRLRTYAVLVEKMYKRGRGATQKNGGRKILSIYLVSAAGKLISRAQNCQKKRRRRPIFWLKKKKPEKLLSSD